MFKLLSAQSITAAALAAMAGTLAAFVTPVLPQARAAPQIQAEVSHLKGDRLAVPARGRTCSLTSWPNYDRSCQFDLRRSADDTRTVRVVSMARLGTPVLVAAK